MKSGSANAGFGTGGVAFNGSGSASLRAPLGNSFAAGPGIGSVSRLRRLTVGSQTSVPPPPVSV